MTPETTHRPLSTPVFQILLSLVGEELHGYAIIQDIARRTGGEVRLTASTLYDAVRRLVEAGWIEEVTARSGDAKDDARRRYYRTTRAGLAAAQGEAVRLERLAAMARAKLVPHLPPTSPGGRA